MQGRGASVLQMQKPLPLLSAVSEKVKSCEGRAKLPVSSAGGRVLQPQLCNTTGFTTSPVAPTKLTLRKLLALLHNFRFEMILVRDDVSLPFGDLLILTDPNVLSNL